MTTEILDFEKTNQEITEKQNGLAVYEEFAEISIFDKGNNLPSFGNHTLAENEQKAMMAVKKLQKYDGVFGRSNSNVTHAWYNLAGLHWTRQIKQITAAVASKRSAVNEAKAGVAKKLAQLKKLKKSIAEMDDGPDKEIKIASAYKLYSQVKDSTTYYQAGLKDILVMEKFHDQIIAKHGELDETMHEQNEVKAIIYEMFIKGMRDVRQHGKLTTGTQQVFDSNGISPTYAFRKIQEFIKQEYTTNSPKSASCFEFAERQAEELASVGLEFFKEMGIDLSECTDLHFTSQAMDELVARASR